MLKRQPLNLIFKPKIIGEIKDLSMFDIQIDFSSDWQRADEFRYDSWKEARQMAADAGDLAQEMLTNPDLTPRLPPLRDIEQPKPTTGSTTVGNKT